MKLIRAGNSCYPEAGILEAKLRGYVVGNIAPRCHSYKWTYKSWADQVIETNLNYATHKK